MTQRRNQSFSSTSIQKNISDVNNESIISLTSTWRRLFSWRHYAILINKEKMYTQKVSSKNTLLFTFNSINHGGHPRKMWNHLKVLYASQGWILSFGKRSKQEILEYSRVNGLSMDDQLFTKDFCSDVQFFGEFLL